MLILFLYVGEQFFNFSCVQKDLQGIILTFFAPIQKFFGGSIFYIEKKNEF